MEQITINELKHYLGVGLKILDGTQVKMMNAAQGSSSNWIGISSVLKWQDLPRSPQPILYPLSMLTKEIEHNEEELVPLIRLAEILFADNDAEKDWFVSNGYVVSSAGLTFGLDEDMSWYISDKDFYQVRRTFGLDQKLFEWRFDVFGLIDKGLAIDVSTLDKNPYH